MSVLERLFPPVLAPGWSGPFHLQVLLHRLEQAAPEDRAGVSWVWVKEAVKIGMDKKTAEHLREAAMAICNDGLP